MNHSLRSWALCLGIAALTASNALAQGTLFQARRVALTSQPTHIAFAPGDSSRLFAASRGGRISIIDLRSGQSRPEAFLQVAATGTNGFLNLVFPPDYSRYGYFYMYVQGPSGTGARQAVLRARVSASDPNIADPASVTTVMRTFGASGQHTGSMPGFGPDGYLYILSGDESGDPQSLGSWGGKVVRIDVDGPDNIPGNDDDDAFPADALRNYSIPADNPYVGVANALPEIWGLGLRNPYRSSIDRETGDIWIGDVGGGQREEVSRLPDATPGLNFGWPIIEGFRCNSSAANCARPGFTVPVLDYPRSGSGPIVGSSVIGGYVYRGCAMPWLRGTYIFGDFYSPYLASARLSGAGVVGFTRRTPALLPASTLLSGVTGWCESPAGELYFCRLQQNEVWTLEPSTNRDCNANGTPDACEGIQTCLADFNGDCGVTIEDLLSYLDAFGQGVLSADTTDALGSGLVDAGVGVEDLLAFLEAFAGGC